MNLFTRPTIETLFASALSLVFITLTACSTEGDRKLPGVYRVDVQQGNVIEQEMIDKLRPGMDRNQVRFIMGTPAIADPFHAERWDYLFTQSKSGRTRKQRHVKLFFKDDKLTHVEGDIVPGERKSPDDLEVRAASVEVPLDKNQPGVFSRMFDALPFIGDDTPQQKEKPESSGTEEPETDAAKDEPVDAGKTTSAEPQSHPQPQIEQELPSP